MSERLPSRAQAVRMLRQSGCPGNVLRHCEAVAELAVEIGETCKQRGLNVDLDLIEIGALLHDIGRVREDQDNSGNTDHASLSADMAETILKSLGDSEELIKQVKHCILSHRFRSSVDPRTEDARIFFDADKLVP